MINRKRELIKANFICSYCKINSETKWLSYSLLKINQGKSYYKLLDNKFNISFNNSITKSLRTPLKSIDISICENCNNVAIWLDHTLIYPKTLLTEKPIANMPIDIKNIYLEASKIVELSPSSAGALLRLALQNLITYLGYTDDLDNCIHKLVKKGLDESILAVLESIKVIGNNPIKPGEINLSEKKSDVLILFNVLNYLVKILIKKNKSFLKI
ncbi:DUF4145 domain-containing protein [Clostridium chrysemydis]|uniref:DUF4145 domain-containing protein n=1 Tax=Clostridium chrysemydis TaxID=2665504 RepID=UPI0018844540|nr:DUF4145 domain-containing protein [Clostridium chrysemydis]